MCDVGCRPNCRTTVEIIPCASTLHLIWTHRLLTSPLYGWGGGGTHCRIVHRRDKGVRFSFFRYPLCLLSSSSSSLPSLLSFPFSFGSIPSPSFPAQTYNNLLPCSNHAIQPPPTPPQMFYYGLAGAACAFPQL